MVMARWFDLVSLMLTSADVILSKVSEKGKILIVNLYVLFFSEVKWIKRLRIA